MLAVPRHSRAPWPTNRDIIMHQFTTQRLHMRLLDERDKALYCSLYTDPIVMEKIGKTLAYEKTEKSFAIALKLLNATPQRHYVWLISDKHTGEALGMQNIAINKHDSTQAEFGIMLTPKSYGKHIAFESIGALTEYGLHTLKLQKMYSYFQPSNTAILKIAQRLNYQIDMQNLQPNTGQASCYMLQAQYKDTFIQH
ncbi:GNAT family N-acetyltransferase [Shewanella sp. Scap07]|uniref:GNAT family N-acetyltransferase n=1 Tax=Shewanella sp. Scap07 TaxID=2589987 RepID=UPI0015C10589|nr:GNAT family N-acetyltransferase [Shewanella sp. Scap07]